MMFKGKGFNRVKVGPCPFFVYDKRESTNSRGKLFDAVSVLWALSPEKSFITFTLPSLAGGVYQGSPTCIVSGDIAIGQMFSRTLEAWKVKEKRRGVDLQYVWVAEAQMKRQQKYGGCGDIHYHLVVNKKLKNDRGWFVDRETFIWLQNNWCEQVHVKADNCVHVDPIPDGASSIPSYLSKYMGKGEQRAIVSRKFQATQNLTKYKPIKLSTPPDLDIIREVTFTTPSGFDVVSRYYNTREILEQYAEAMRDESLFSASRGNGRSLTEHAMRMDAAKASYLFS